MGEARNMISAEYDRVIRNALITQAALGCFAALILDGGIIARVVGVAVLGFWLCTVLLVLRRRFKPSRIDLAFIQWGFWPVLAVTVLRQAFA
ncbi:MAG: hypothetical protein JWN70_682 [Planctomycetaceae bacterium]|nr:hypothetical protein [Planctomycetaceae bacterium]